MSRLAYGLWVDSPEGNPNLFPNPPVAVVSCRAECRERVARGGAHRREGRHSGEPHLGVRVAE